MGAVPGFLSFLISFVGLGRGGASSSPRSQAPLLISAPQLVRSIGVPYFPYILTLQSPCGLYSRGAISCFLSPLPGPPALHETSLTIEPFACLFYYHRPLALAHKYIPSFPRQPRPSPEPLPHRPYYTPSAYCSSWLPHTLHSPPQRAIPTMAGSRTNVLNRELPRR